VTEVEGQATVSGGSCGFVTSISAQSEDGRHARFSIDSPCEHVQALAFALHEHGAVDVFAEMDWHQESSLSAIIRGSMEGSYLWCPVPFALRKAMQMACGLSLPEEIAVELSKPDGAES